ncbi:MAG: lysophospholipid acyltransferase family protein [Candidatus Limnocylindria bacterium]
MGDLLLGAGLRAADLVARLLPQRAAYGLADLIGWGWYRLAPSRRTLVAANLARVSAATGRPTSGRAFRRLVRQAFIEHARYYLELLRIPHASIDKVAAMVSVDEWERWEPFLREGAVVATLHLGNPEPYGSLLAARGLHAVVPVEEITPKALYNFLFARRASGRGVTMVPLSQARRPLIEELRRGGIAGVVADRNLSGDGHRTLLFGEPTRLPIGPASLALISGRPLVVAACWRVGPERFNARPWLIEAELSGDRRADVATLTDAMARRMEEAIGAAPEQWFAAFQPIWDEELASRG